METKAWYASKTVWGAIVMGISGIIQAFGLGAISDAEQQKFVDGCLYLADFIGFIVVLVGRWTATKGLSAKKPESVALLSAIIFVFALPFCFAAIAADVDLKWDAVTGATGYKVYKSEDNGATWGVPVDVGNVTTHKWLSVTDTKMVLFRVSVYSGTSESIRLWSGAWWDSRLKPLTSPGGNSIP